MLTPMGHRQQEFYLLHYPRKLGCILRFYPTISVSHLFAYLLCQTKRLLELKPKPTNYHSYAIILKTIREMIDKPKTWSKSWSNTTRQRSIVLKMTQLKKYLR